MHDMTDTETEIEIASDSPLTARASTLVRDLNPDTLAEARRGNLLSIRHSGNVGPLNDGDGVQHELQHIVPESMRTRLSAVAIVHTYVTPRGSDGPT